MKKLMLTTALLVAFQPAFAESGHIADDVFVFIHGGPSNKFRITGRVRSGSPITILKKSPDGKFVQIRTASGKVGWADGNNVASGDSMQIKVPKLETALQKSEAMVTEQGEEIELLAAELDTYKAENSTYTEQLNKLNAEIKGLNRQIEGMDESNLMRWFTHGGLVALGGVILGLLIPLLPKKKKRRDDWF